MKQFLYLYMRKISLILLFAVLICQTLIGSDSIRIESVVRSDWGAYIHFPASQKPLPVIITLGGAEGGLSFTESEANAMAKEGFIVMRFGYFKYSKSTLKETLQEIRVEKVFDAIDHVGRSPFADSSRIALVGVSKGAELALLVGSKRSSVKAVVAHLPSHVVWYGLGKLGGLNKSSWTYEGKPLPYVPYAKPKSGWFTKRIAEFYEAGLEKNPDRISSAVIQVENISGPILLSSGGKDDIWPSSFMAGQIEARLKLKNFPFEVRSLNYPEAGHGIFGVLPDKSDEKALNDLADGRGSVQANYAARQETWAETFSFLKKYLVAD
jgi:dienelactone hydrolase